MESAYDCESYSGLSPDARISCAPVDSSSGLCWFSQRYRWHGPRSPCRVCVCRAMDFEMGTPANNPFTGELLVPMARPDGSPAPPLDVHIARDSAGRVAVRRPILGMNPDPRTTRLLHGKRQSVTQRTEPQLPSRCSRHFWRDRSWRRVQRIA